MFARLFASALAIVLFVAQSAPLFARSEEETIALSTSVLNEFLSLRESGIRDSLLAEAKGVAIIPNVIKAGLVVGGQRGKGVVIVKEKEGLWRAPSFLTLTGGSLGWQAGAQATDIVLVFKTQKSVDGLLKGKFTIGADAAAAAGPVGRRVGAATDGELKAEIYTYSRSRGLFAGISLDGSVIQIESDLNAAYYGVGGTIPPAAQKLVDLIAHVTTHPDGADARSSVESATALAAPAPPPDLAKIKQDLARAATQMNARLDEIWKRYLALPAEVYGGERNPSPELVRAALANYDSVHSDARYAALAALPEFQATHQQLRAYAAELLGAPQGPAKLALPPPPNAGKTSR